MTTISKLFSVELPSIFPLFKDAHHEPASLMYMGAAALLRKRYPEAPVPLAQDSEQLTDGTWVLRDLHHVTIALVDKLGNVQLVGAAPQVDSLGTAHSGIEVTESSPEPVMIFAELLVTTVWRCGGCGTKWTKPGDHVGKTKRCRSCGRESTLRRPK